jgi:hypothetical protein
MPINRIIGTDQIKIGLSREDLYRASKLHLFISKICNQNHTQTLPFDQAGYRLLLVGTESTRIKNSFTSVMVRSGSSSMGTWPRSS